ncbi:MAG: plastocyanin/azurin family copper-binding protein [Candidatus Hodarchaeota archaeon]
MRIALFLMILIPLTMILNFFPVPSVSDVTADEEVAITAGTGNLLIYDRTEIRVSRNSWIELTFKVVSTMSHNLVIEDFTTEGFMGDSRTETINSMGGANNDGIDTILFKTPDKDVTVAFYCSIGSHRALGMEGQLIVAGESALPPSSNPSDPTTPTSNPPISNEPAANENFTSVSSSTSSTESLEDANSSSSVSGFHLATIFAVLIGLAAVTLRFRKR